MAPGILLQAFYQRGDRGVPSPGDSDASAWWYDHVATQAEAFREAGFTAIWLAPVTKGGSGAHSIGYDVFDDYDIGSKAQRGATPTRYGSREQLVRCAAMLRASGIDVYLDLVENHRAGGSGDGGFEFRYRDALGGMHGPDFSFGADLAPVNGQPHGYVDSGLKRAADWLVRAVGAQGVRVDDVKGVSTDFLFPLLGFGSLNGKFAVGEFFDGNIGLLLNWLNNPRGMRGRASAFDFPLHFMLRQMCNGNGHFDLSLLDHAGLAGVAPFQAVTFVQNHDTESKDSSRIRQNHVLAYAYILTSEGYPCVFYKDYSRDHGCLGLKPAIDNLMWIHQNIAEGPTQQRWKEHDLFIFERLGGDHLLVGLNDGTADRTVEVETGFGAGITLHDYTGHGQEVRTGDFGRTRITVPGNAKQGGYCCYSRRGIDRNFRPSRQMAVQEFEGAADLDLPPADPKALISVGRIWARQGGQVVARLAPDRHNWTKQAKLELELVDANGAVLGSLTCRTDTPPDVAVSVSPSRSGWIEFRLRAHEMPPTNLRPGYRVTAKYDAARTLG
jgi:alpha-amylase